MFLCAYKRNKKILTNVYMQLLNAYKNFWKAFRDDLWGLLLNVTYVIILPIKKCRIAQLCGGGK